MLFIGGKILCRRLRIKPVKRSDRKEGSYLHRYFQAGGMCLNTPIVYIVAVVPPQNYPISEKIVKAKANGQLEPVRRKFLNRVYPIGKKDAVERESQIPVLFYQIQQESGLYAGIDDLGKGERGRISLTGTGAIVGMFSIPAACAIRAGRFKFGWEDQLHLVEITAQFQSKLTVVFCFFCSPGAKPNRLVIEFIGIVTAEAERSPFAFVLAGPAK